MAIENQIGFRCPDDLRAWLQKQADREGRKLSDWIRWHFEEKKRRSMPTLDNAKRRG